MMEISREEYERLTEFEREARPMLARLGAELEATGKIIVAIGEFGVKFSELFDELDKVVTEHHGDGEESTVPGCEWDGATVRNITKFVPLQFTIDIDQDGTHTVLECYPDRFVLDGEEISGDEVVGTLKAAAKKLDALDPKKKDPLCPVCNKPQSEHDGGLFCCPYCGAAVRMETKTILEKIYYFAECSACLNGRDLEFDSIEHMLAHHNRRAQ